MNNKMMRLNTICIAQKSLLGNAQTPSGIDKQPVSGEIQLTELGLSNDYHADRRVHGGVEKAVYQFPFENYQMLADALPHLKDKFARPCLGENFSSTGMSDDSVYIGDIYRIGSATIQVSQPRMPCWKLNTHIGNAHMKSLLMALNRSGWYYRVLEEGEVAAGAQFELLERIQQDFTVEQIWLRWNDLREQNQQVAPHIEIKGLSSEWSFDWG